MQSATASDTVADQPGFLSRLLFVAFLGIICWAPIPFGSNEAWAWSILEVLVLAVTAVWLIGYALGYVRLTRVFRKALPILLLLLLWLVLIGFQLMPLPRAIIQSISPASVVVHDLVGSTSPLVPVTVDPYATQSFSLKSLTYCLVFALALLLIDRRGRLRLVAQVIVLSGLFQALYAALLFLSGTPAPFFESAPGSATGTFINRNHLAGYLEITLAVGIGLLMAQLGGPEVRGWRQRLREWLRTLIGPKMRLRIYLAIMVIALVLTHSRMGNSAFFSSLLIAGVISLAVSRHATRSTIVLLSSLIIIDLFIVGTWFGVEKVAQRIEETQLDQDVRGSANPHIIEYWRDYPWLGSGGGTFYEVFPKYRRGDVHAYLDHAHNDYLEFAAETGAVGFLLLGGFVLASACAALWAQCRRRDPLMRGVAFGSLMAIIAFMIHSAVDFNLQIPATAMTFMLVLAFAWLALWLDSSRHTPRKEATRTM